MRAALAGLVLAAWAALPSSHARADAPLPDEPTLECADERCPEAVAWLVNRVAGDEIGCTAFLVATDTLATARHCIAPARNDGGRALPPELVAVFAATRERPAERHRARVVRLAPAAALSIQSASDWALLRLETHSARAPLPIDRLGVADDLPVTIPTIELVADRRARLGLARCATVQRSLFAPHVDGPLTPVVVLAGCDVRPGQSGAPVLDAAGRVRALVHARDLRRWPWQEPLRWPAALAGATQTEPLPIAYATSFVCVDFARLAARPATCALDAWLERTRRPGDAADEHARQVRSEADAIAERARSEAATLAGSRDPRERWSVEIRRGATTIDVVATPTCLVDTRALPQGVRVAIVVAANGRPETRVSSLPTPSAPTCAGR